MAAMNCIQNALLNDHELPVKVEAAMALSAFLASQVKAEKIVEPNVSMECECEGFWSLRNCLRSLLCWVLFRVKAQTKTYVRSAVKCVCRIANKREIQWSSWSYIWLYCIFELPDLYKGDVRVYISDPTNRAGVAEGHQRDGERRPDQRDVQDSHHIHGPADAHRCRNVHTAGRHLPTGKS